MNQPSRARPVRIPARYREFVVRNAQPERLLNEALQAARAWRSSARAVDELLREVADLPDVHARVRAIRELLTAVGRDICRSIEPPLPRAAVAPESLPPIYRKEDVARARARLEELSGQFSLEAALERIILIERLRLGEPYHDRDPRGKSVRVVQMPADEEARSAP